MSDYSQYVDTSVPINAPITVDEEDHNVTTASVPFPSKQPVPDSSSCINIPAFIECVEVSCLANNSNYPRVFSKISEDGHLVINYDDDDVETLKILTV